MPTQKEGNCAPEDSMVPLLPNATSGRVENMGREGFRTSPEDCMYLDSYVPIMLRLLSWMPYCKRSAIRTGELCWML